MKKPVPANPTERVKPEIKPDKQNKNSDPVAMVELRGQIIDEHNHSIRMHNAIHKH